MATWVDHITWLASDIGEYSSPVSDRPRIVVF